MYLMKIYIVRISFLFLIAVFFISCAHIPVNLGIAKQQLISYHESGRYDKDVAKAVEGAINQLDDINVAGSSAVVFDVDETSLSNYEINKELDFGYVPELWNEWIKKASAPAIPEVKRLYDYLVKRNIRVIFITGRKSTQYIPTFNNLKHAGYAEFDTLITRGENEYNLSASDYKSRKRVELTHKGYKIIGDVGDQESDMTGLYTGIQVRIPNYQYIIY